MASIAVGAEEAPWEECSPEVNPIENSAILKEPHRLVFVYEGYTGYAPQWAKATRDHGREAKKSDSTIAYPLAFYYVVHQQILKNEAPQTYWLYFASHHARMSTRCIARLAALQLPGGKFHTIALVGFSNGAKAVAEIVRALKDKHQVQVDLAFTIDPVPRVLELTGKVLRLAPDSGRRIVASENVSRWVNHYENTDSTVQGHEVRSPPGSDSLALNVLHEDLGKEAHFGGAIVRRAAPLVLEEILKLPEGRTSFRYFKE